MRRMFMVVGIVGVALLRVGCGNDDDFAASDSADPDAGGLIDAGESLSGLQVVNPSCGAGAGGEQDDCDDCVITRCGSQFEECFGAAWQSELAGVCTEFGTCVQACDCGDPDCFGTCTSELESTPSDPCLSCVRSLLKCEVLECEAVCLGDEQPGAQRDGGGAATADAGSDGRA